MPDSGAVDLTDRIGAAGQDEPGTPKWWLATLEKRLDERRPAIDRYDAYYEGDHPLAFATSKFREAFGSTLEELADNWCPPIVDASAERLTVEGFRFDDESESDRDVWELWQRNDLDVFSAMAHVEAIKAREAYALVEPRSGGVPRITIETPDQFIVATDPGDRRRRLAALKKWTDDDGMVFATVYLPGGAYRFQKTTKAGAPYVERTRGLAGGLAVVDYARVFGGLVPAVPIANNPGLKSGGRSDLDPVIPLQNALNKLVADMLVASEFSAFRQRLLTGVEIPRYPEGHPQEGEPMNEAFISAVSRLLVVEEEGARAQEFGQTDLGNFVKVIDLFVQHVAAITRTPPHYLVGQVVNVSGDALTAAETGLVAKTRGKSKPFGQGWEDTVRLALKAMGNPRAEANVVETVWGDMESRSLAEVADATLKLKEIGVPRAALWERVGASQAEIARWEKEYQKEQAELIALGLAGTRPGDQGVADEPLAAKAGATPTGGTPGGGVDAG